MSETEAEEEDETEAASEEEATEEEAAQEEAETTDTSQESSGGGSGVDVGAYLSLSDAEQETLQDWVIYLAGVFGAIGLAQGLNIVIQNRWNHGLVFAGPGFRSPVIISPRAVLTIGLVAVPLLAILLALKVGHEEETPYKVAAATSLVGLLVLGLVSAAAGAVPAGGVSFNAVNTAVSSLGAGIAGAIGAIIVVYVTQEFAPDSLTS